MLDSTKGKSSECETRPSQESEPFGGPYKIIIGYAATAKDFVGFPDNDEFAQEALRINMQFLKRWRADHPNDPVTMDVSTVLELLPSEVY